MRSKVYSDNAREARLMLNGNLMGKDDVDVSCPKPPISYAFPYASRDLIQYIINKLYLVA